MWEEGAAGMHLLPWDCSLDWMDGPREGLCSMLLARARKHALMLHRETGACPLRLQLSDPSQKEEEKSAMKKKKAEEKLAVKVCG